MKGLGQLDAQQARHQKEPRMDDDGGRDEQRRQRKVLRGPPQHHKHGQRKAQPKQKLPVRVDRHDVRQHLQREAGRHLGRQHDANAAGGQDPARGHEKAADHRVRHIANPAAHL